MRSMTGFGTGTAKSDNLLIVTEIKSVNSRFLEINFRSDYSNQNNLENISRQVIKERMLHVASLMSMFPLRKLKPLMEI